MADLTAPISSDAPSGTYLKEADKSKYRSLRNAFNASRSAYRSLIETPTTLNDAGLQDANEAAWQVLSEQTEEALTQDTKDAEIFIWHTGSQVHLSNGLSKTTEALSQLAAVLESNWDTLNPRPSVEKLTATDEKGQAKEIAEGIAKVFLQLIGELPGTGLLVPPLGDLPIFGEASYNDYLSAEANGTSELFSEEARTYAASSVEALSETLFHLRDLLEAAEACGKVLGEKAHADGAQGVSFRFLTDHINSMIGAMRHTLETTLVPWPLDKVEEPEVEEESGDEGGSKDASASGTGAPKTTSGNFINDRISSRQDAVSALEALARFFRETEPHSPIYLLLERAARWSRKDLPSLYGELLGQDSSELNRLTFLTGLESAGTVAKAPMSALDRFLGSNEHLLTESSPMDISTPEAGESTLSSAPTPPTPAVVLPEGNGESGEASTEEDSDVQGVLKIEW